MQGIYFTQVMTGSEIVRDKNCHVYTCTISIPISSLMERKDRMRGVHSWRGCSGATPSWSKALIISSYKQFLNQKSGGI